MFNIINRSRYFSNSLWMISDRIFYILSGFIWSVILARAVGIQEFGGYNSVVATVGIFLPLAAFGLNGLLNKLFLEEQYSVKQTILVGWGLKFFAGLLCSLLACAWLKLSVKLELNEYSFFYALILLLHSLQVFESLNQAFSTSKLISLSRLFSTLLFLFAKLGCWWLGVLTLELALLLQACELLCYFTLVAIVSIKKYSGKLATDELLSFDSSINTAKLMVSGGFFLVLSSVAESLNLKVDVLMLTEMASLESVSIYSVATKFSESGYFFAAAIATSYFPQIMRAKSESQQYYYECLKGLIKKLFLVSLGVFLFTAVAAYPAIIFLYGEEYISSYYVLLVHLFASLFIYFRAVFSKWIVAENLLHFSLLTHLFGAVSNIGLNIYMIPMYGYYGAALSTVISYAVSSYISLLFFKDTRRYLQQVKFVFKRNYQ